MIESGLIQISVARKPRAPASCCNKKGSPAGCPIANLISNLHMQGGPASLRNVPLSENQPWIPTEREL
jgi:hypothetical protein